MEKCEDGVLGKADAWFLVRNAGALFRRGDEVVITQWTDRRVHGVRAGGRFGGSGKPPSGLG